MPDSAGPSRPNVRFDLTSACRRFRSISKLSETLFFQPFLAFFGQSSLESNMGEAGKPLHWQFALPRSSSHSTLPSSLSSLFPLRTHALSFLPRGVRN